MTKYIFSKAAGQFVTEDEWWAGPDGQARRSNARSDLPMPYFWADIPEYRSPIDGKLITSRSARREDLRANGCVEYDGPSKPRHFRNAKWAAKRGATAQLAPEIREELKI